MKCKRKIMVGIAFVAVVLCILFQSNTFGRKKSELIIEEVDLKNNCIYATAKNQLYDTDDNYIIYGVSNYLKGNLQLSYLKEGESILVISTVRCCYQIRINLIKYTVFNCCNSVSF